jgi:hypothetical protein
METVHGIYTPGHCCYWADKPPKAFLINYRFVSPIFVFVMLGAAVWGMKQRVVTLAESAYSLVVLLIPLVLQGPRCCFAAQPRYVISAFPIFLAFGIWLALRPSWISLPLVVLSAVVMCVFAALSISWYPIY